MPIATPMGRLVEQSMPIMGMAGLAEDVATVRSVLVKLMEQGKRPLVLVTHPVDL